jgi:glycyl-tRNA synthetase beta chain
VAELLIEIGLEEIPASWLEGLAGQLKTQFETIAGRELLEPTGVEIAWAPRRLALGAQVVKKQKDREECVFGPPVKAAKTPAGEWTPAALGFAKKSGCAPENLREGRKEGSPEPYLTFTRKTPGRPAIEILPGVIAAALRGLAFPKRMNWDAWLDDGKGAFPFGRPIRWLVALIDGETVPFTIYAAKDGARGEAIVLSGHATRGHRFLPRGQAGQSIVVRSFSDLEAKLASRYVILDPAERETRVKKALAPHAGRIRDDHGLPAEWRDLVEYPTVVFGTIPAEFRSLPSEVIETVLVHHQKYLPITGSGRSVERFAAVINTDDANAAEIVRGMERVVVARLRDAAFFFEEDLKRPLAERSSDLAGVTFHQKLGSYKDKTERLLRLIDAMGPTLGLLTKAEHEAAREAAAVAKADLTTLMVREFPELQGAMGAIYLRAQGGSHDNVIRAVQWHYHPLSIEVDAAPAGDLHGGEATVFGAVSIADKLDTLAGYFGLGLIPTGSSDPFGLRRAAQGVIRVLIDFWGAADGERRPSLRKLIASAVAGHGATAKRPPVDVVADLESFLLDRLRYVFVARGYAADEVEAVLGAREPDAIEDPKECALRLAALKRVRAEAAEDFEHLAVAFKRAKNILGSAPTTALDPALFDHDAERELHAAVTRLASAGGDYEARLRALATLRAPVDRFFDDVLVMAEDERVRANRLGLLTQALALFYRVADVSRLS